MIRKYSEIQVESLDDKTIDRLYEKLLKDKSQFYILSCNKKQYCLTKEVSLFEIGNKQKFLQNANDDIYYKTEIDNREIEINETDLNIFRNYLEKFKSEFLSKKYGNKFLFGTVAVKTDNGFITTTRGKTDLSDYVVVENVDNISNIVTVCKNKATLNAPLLHNIFKNKKVKTIVHLHCFDEKLVFQDYAFPGTVRDSVRDNTTSFNIKSHGVVYLFDEVGNLI